MVIKFLKVGCGDSIFIHYLDSNGIGRNIVIDTGHHQKRIYTRFFREVNEIIQRNEKIDLLILTHRDDDHIGGLWKLVKSHEFDIDAHVEKIWLNHTLPISEPSSKISIGKAVDLKEAFQKAGKCSTEPITTLSEPFDIYGVKITILSPDRPTYEREAKQILKEEQSRKISSKHSDHGYSISHLKESITPFEEDKSLSNRSSIAFLLEYNDKSTLFLADAHPSIICNSLKRLGYPSKKELNLEFVKISHHGSRRNTSPELLSLFHCQNFIFSTNGKNRHRLPDKETIVRILKNPERDMEQKVKIYFNQKDDVLANIFSVDDTPFKKYNFEVIFPEEKETLTIKL